MSLDEQIIFIEQELEITKKAENCVPAMAWGHEKESLMAVLESLYRLRDLEK
jgi:hypothetical protein